MTIHSSDPFADPPGARSGVRRLRARLPAAVTLWTAAGVDGRPAGLTVSSTLVSDGDPGRLLGVLDEESEVWEAIEATGLFVVAPLGEPDRQLADKFAGLLPAPGGVFSAYEWRSTPFGPVLSTAEGWAGCRVDSVRPFGWGLLVEATIDIVEIGAEQATGPLVHYRARYRDLSRE